MSKRTSFLIYFYLTVFFFLVFTALARRVILLPRATSEDPPPLLVKVSNINSGGFTVSWLTEKESTGEVVFHTSKSDLEKSPQNSKIAYDARGAAAYKKTHHITLNSLQPNTNYYFLIKSGKTFFYKNLSGGWSSQGLADEQKTPAETGLEGAIVWGDNFKPNIIAGQILTPQGEKIPEALVFLEIPGKSHLLSALTDKEGKWVFNLANLVDKKMSGYLSYKPGVDLLRITAQESNQKIASVYKLIPGPEEQIKPVSLTLAAAVEPETVFMPSITPTDAPFLTSPPVLGTLSIRLKLQAISRKGPDRKISFSFTQKEKSSSFDQSAVFQSDEAGVYSGQIDGLAPGTYDIAVMAPGHLKVNLKNFAVKTGLNSLNLTTSPLAAGDLNSDGAVNIEDLGILIDEFRNSIAKDHPADFNGDSQINSLDLGILINNYRLTSQ